MEAEDVRPWPALPKECLESIARHGGAESTAKLSTVCRSWRQDLSDDILWRDWHWQGMPLLRYHSWRTSFAYYSSALRSWLAGRPTGQRTVPAAHERWVTCLDLSPRHVLSGSMDANVKLWDRNRPGAWLQYLRGHTGPVAAVRLAYDGSGGSTACSYGAAYSGSRDGSLRVWDLANGACVRSISMEGGRQWVNTLAVWRRHDPPSTPAAAASGGHHLAATAVPSYAASAVVCGTSLGDVCLYDVRQPGPATHLLHPGQNPPGAGGQNGVMAARPAGAVYGTAVAGNALAAGCASGLVYVWDLRTRAVRHVLDEQHSAVTCVALAGETLVAGDLEGGLYLWSTQPSTPRLQGVIPPPGGAAAATTAPVAAAAVPAVAWPQWRVHPHGVRVRQYGTYGNGRSVSGSSSKAAQGAGGGEPYRSGVGATAGCSIMDHDADCCSDEGSGDDKDVSDVGTCVATALAELAHGRTGAAVPPPLRLAPPLHPATSTTATTVMAPASPWLYCRSPSAAAEATGQEIDSTCVSGIWGRHGGSTATGAAGPGLAATLRHAEWVRAVALLGPRLLLSASKDGLLYLSRTDIPQVIAAWDVASSVRGSAAAMASSPEGSCAGCEARASKGSDGNATSQVVNQVHALAADEWGLIAGCQDASLRMWSFTPGSVVPELSR